MAKKEECIVCKRAKMGGYAGEIKCTFYGRKPQFDETACSNFVDAGEVVCNLDKPKPSKKTAADIINEHKQQEADLREEIRKKYNIEGDISEEQYQQLRTIYLEEGNTTPTTNSPKVSKYGLEKEYSKKTVWTIISLVILVALGAYMIIKNNVFSVSEQGAMRYTVKMANDCIFPAKSVRIFECTENGDRIRENEFALEPGDSKTFTSKPQTRKIKVYITIITPINFSGQSGWLPLVYYLSPNENNVIMIDNNLELSRFEP